MVRRDQTVSASLVIPSVLGLTAQLEDMPTRYHVKFITTLKSPIDVYTVHRSTRTVMCHGSQSTLQAGVVFFSSDQLASMKQNFKTEVVRVQQPTELQVSRDDLEPTRKRSNAFPFMGKSQGSHNKFISRQ